MDCFSSAQGITAHNSTGNKHLRQNLAKRNGSLFRRAVLHKCMAIEQFPRHFIVPRQLNKEVTDALVVQHEATERFKFFYQDKNVGPIFHFHAEVKRNSRERQPHHSLHMLLLGTGHLFLGQYCDEFRLEFSSHSSSIYSTITAYS